MNEKQKIIKKNFLNLYNAIMVKEFHVSSIDQARRPTPMAENCRFMNFFIRATMPGEGHI